MSRRAVLPHRALHGHDDRPRVWGLSSGVDGGRHPTGMSRDQVRGLALLQGLPVRGHADGVPMWTVSARVHRLVEHNRVLLFLCVCPYDFSMRDVSYVSVREIM